MEAKIGLRFEFMGETPSHEIKVQVWEVKDITSKCVFIQSVTFPEITSKFSHSGFNKFVTKKNVIK